MQSEQRNALASSQSLEVFLLFLLSLKKKKKFPESELINYYASLKKEFTDPLPTWS